MTHSFDGVTIPHSHILNQQESATSFTATLQSKSSTLADFDGLVSRYKPPVGRRVLLDHRVSLTGPGTVGNLVLGANTYTNCMIISLSIIPENALQTHWICTATFEKDTAL